MDTNSVQVGIEASNVPVRPPISISRWVNEPNPVWDQILTAHDVARLVRRPRWVLSSMAVVGRFPRMHYFRGKRIGWLKADILEWMTRRSGFRDAAAQQSPISRRRRRSDLPGQQALPFERGPTNLTSASPIPGVKL